MEGVRSVRLPIFALLGANALSMIGNVLTFVAIPWFVLQTTGSAAKTGMTGGAATLAVVLAAFFGGPIVDRLGYRQTSVVSDLASAVTVALIPLLYATVGLAFWELLALVFLGGILDGPGMTARLSLLPDLASRARMPIERANSAFQAIERSSFLFGPPLSGVLIAALGTSNVLWVDAATFVVSAAVVSLAVPAPEREIGAASGYFHDLLSGLRFIWEDSVILSITAVAVVLNALDSPVFSVVLPVYADENFGTAVSLGAMIAGFGAGALAGAAVFGIIGHRMPRRGTLIVGWVLVGLPFWVLAAEPSLILSTAALVVTGIASGPLNPIIFTLVQERAPDELRGRVTGTLISLAMMAMPVGMLLAGFLIEAIGLRTVLVAVAASYLIVSLTMFLNPAFRGMDAPKKNGPEGGNFDLQNNA